jgi:RNA polymerase sigma-70 factor (ECF subfamily)
MDGLADLYDAHASALYAFALNLTRSPTGAEDILQDVFVKLARGGTRIEPGLLSRSYLFAMAHRAIIDAARRRESRERRHEAASAEKPGALFQPDPDRELFATETALALADLPNEQRAVVHLKLWEDFTFEQIAAALEISPNTAASRYRYGLDKMRERLRSLYKEMRDGT